MAILSFAASTFLLSGAGRLMLIDLVAASLGGFIIGAALGIWLVPAVVDRLHRGK